MSKFLDRFRYFKQLGDTFSQDHGQELNVNRDWENSYRSRWQHDKIVRSTHGVNCTGSCSWKIYVKNGLVTWETQQTDYPRTRPICLIMNPVVVRVVRAIHGIYIALTALNTQWCVNV